jgi:hypothetical protein
LRIETEAPAKQGSISFLKKETKNFYSFRARSLQVDAAGSIDTNRNEQKFFGFFFKKELLSWRLPSLTVSRAQCG